MQVRFNAQPFVDGRDMREFVETIGNDADLDNLEIVVAWAKRSGLEVIECDLRGLAQRGCNLRLIVGIDQGGATRQGLELARVLFDEVSVFHDRGGRTFHPKVYVAWGDTSARILVGSHNVTAGGAYFNYEAGIELTLERPADDELLFSFRDFVDELRSDTAMCRVLTPDVLSELVSNPRYKIADEDLRHNPGVAGVPPELDTETDIETIPEPPVNPPSIFGPSALPKKPAPAAVTKAVAKKAAAKKAPAKKAPAKKAAAVMKATGGGPVGTGHIVLKRWFRVMDGTAAQHPPNPNTHPTHNLRLTLGRPQLPINKYTWHRQQMFGPLAWTPVVRNGEQVEVAQGQFRVIEMGVDRGVHTLEISHAPHREESQNNIPTVLHWGTVEPLLAATDHTGRNVIIERLDNGTFRLEITAAQPTAQDHIG
jgi:PLD-like domain